MHRYMHLLSKLVFVMCSLIAVYVTLLTISYCIPDEFLKEAVDDGKEVMSVEGDGPELFFNGAWACRLDNFTDTIMLQTTFRGDQSPFLAALNNNDYARYWHGYQIFLRPMCLLRSYTNIRYVNMYIFFIVLLSSLILMKEQLGWGVSLLFLISCLSGYSFIVPMSLQFSGVYYILLFSIIGVLIYYKKKKNIPYQLALHFLVIGSFTNFVDLLTFPLLTLGLPLAVICIIILEKQIKKGLLPVIIKSSISWGIGYGVTWISKWILATVFLKKNIIGDAIENAKFRSFGDTGGGPLNRTYMFITNIKNIMPAQSIKIGLCVLLVIVLIWLVLVIRAHKSFNNIKKAFPILILAVMPYVWFMIMANHSQMHYWFTYRIQMISVFILFYFLFYCVDISKLTGRVYQSNQ